MSDQISQFLDIWADEMNMTGILSSIFRAIGWFIINSLAKVASQIEGFAKDIYNLLPRILDRIGIGGIFEDYRGLLTILLTLSIIATGYYFIFKKDKGSGSILQNILLIFLTLTVMPVLAANVATFTSAGAISVMDSFESGGTSAYAIVDSGITDMRKVILDMGDDFETSEAEHNEIIANSARKNAFDAKYLNQKIRLFDENESIDYDDSAFSSEQSELLSSKTVLNIDGNIDIIELDDGFLGIGKEYYYRYDIDWLPLLVSLIAISLTYILAIFRLASILWEVILDMIISPFVAVTDLMGGNRIKELLKGILSLCAVFALIGVLLGAYGLGIEILNGLRNDTGTLLYLFLLIALSWVVINGPNSIARIFGVDAGVRSGFTLFAVGRTAGHVAGMPRRLFKNMAEDVRAVKSSAAAARSFTQKHFGGAGSGIKDSAGSEESKGGSKEKNSGSANAGHTAETESNGGKRVNSTNTANTAPEQPNDIPASSSLKDEKKSGSAGNAAATTDEARLSKESRPLDESSSGNVGAGNNENSLDSNLTRGNLNNGLNEERKPSGSERNLPTRERGKEGGSSRNISKSASAGGDERGSINDIQKGSKAGGGRVKSENGRTRTVRSSQSQRKENKVSQAEKSSFGKKKKPLK